MGSATYRAAGDRGILITFGSRKCEEVFRKVLAFDQALERLRLEGVVDTNRAFCSVFVHYDPLRTSYGELLDRLKEVELRTRGEFRLGRGEEVLEVPVVYGGSYGPDLPWVADQLGISEEEVARRHSAKDYLVYMTGHIGGSVFFLGDDELFHLPRKKTPVLSHPAGSIVFAAGMGGIKGADGPTAWYKIGQCPLRQWQPECDPPTLINSGDTIRFYSVAPSEYESIASQVRENRFRLVRRSPGPK